MGSVRRARELSDIAPHYIAKSGLCSTSELETTRWGSIKIQHVTGLTNVAEEKSRFPKLDECAHFHYEHVEIGPLEVSIIDNDNRKISSNESEEEKWWSLCVQSQNKTWLIRRSYENFRMLDQQLHRCIYDRKFSDLAELPAKCIENQENTHKLLSDYMKRFSIIAGNVINCGPILNWLELDNRGHRLLVPDNDNCPINTPAVAAAYSVKRYTAQAPDEISFEVGDMISVIDMPPPEESIWWHGKRGFQVGFFPCECVAVIGDKVPRNLKFASEMSQPTKPVLRKHGKLIAFFRSFILSRPSRRRLKESGILKERVFGCDLGEHLLNSGHEIPMVLKCCVEFIETHGLVDGIYRLSGITSNIQKLRNAFDEDRVPALYEDEAILQDVHSVASLLKMYFRELPNPLCTYQLYHQFVAAVQSTQKDDPKLMKMRDVVQKLPPPHYRTLEYLMRHLARVSEKGHETGMTSRNIAIVWAPNLLRCKELEVGGVAALQGVGVQAVVTEFLVCYADLIFCDRLPNFSLPSQQVSTKKCRPKSLAISTPTKLLSLEEARTRVLNQTSGKAEPEYIEVGGGPSNLPAKYHTVIELPGYSRKRMGSKRSPLGWKLLFGKSGRSSQSRKDIECKPVSCEIGVMQGKAVTESDLAQSRRHLRPSKSAESLSSSRNSEMVDVGEPPNKEEGIVEDSLSPMLLRVSEVKNGHNRSVSHESYFGQLQDQKVNLTLDISEIQVNFDLEESEMRIFSEDETLMSTGSGSLASNSSPRVLPSQKSGKGNSIKRLSYPKLSSAEDRFDNSQNTDPSPKKQKTNDENIAKSKLEERLSDSVGDIQFIDSVSPDQGLTHGDEHPIQSPSPVSSISQISSLLHPSSPILPHIPHLTEQFSVSVEPEKDLNHFDADHGFIKNVDSSPKDSSNSFALSPSVASSSIVKITGSYLTNSHLIESTVSEKESFSAMNSELTTPDTPICSTYTPLVDFEDSSLSNMTTPDFDMSVKIDKFASDNFEACLDFDNYDNVGDKTAKKEAKIPDDDSMDLRSPCESVTSRMIKLEPLKSDIMHPIPVERKAKIVHPYVNIPIQIPETQEEIGTKTDFDKKELIASNRNSVASIKYECISTESSCDSLINVNKDDEDTTPLDFQCNESPASENENPCISIEITKKTLDASPSGHLSAVANQNQDHETTGLNDFYQLAEKEFVSEDNLSKNDEEIDFFWKSICGNRKAPEELKIFDQNESLISTNMGDNCGNEELIESKLLRKSEVNCFDVVQLTEKAETQNNSAKTLGSFENDSASVLSAQEANKKKSIIIEEKFAAEKNPNSKDPLTDDFINVGKFLSRQTSEGVLETDLDAPECSIGRAIFESIDKAKETEEKLISEKENVPQKSNSSGNVRQLLSKFEFSPPNEKLILESGGSVFEPATEKDRKQSNASKKDYFSTLKGKSFEERPKTLERLSTRRKMERDGVEATRIQLGKSKSGSQINDKTAEGDKSDILLSCDFDLSDPQRRERIEKYKEKRRNYLREKYRSDSFKNDKDDVSFKFKQKYSRKNEWGEANDGRNSFKSQKSQCDQSLECLKEKKSLEKKDRSAGSKLWKKTELSTNDSDQRSFSVDYSDKSRGGHESVSSSLKDHSEKRNNIFIFSCDKESVCDFKSTKSSPEKKNHFLNFSLGGSSEEDIQSADSWHRKSPRRRKEASRSSSLPNPREQEIGARIFVKQKGDNSSSEDSQTPFLCIKDMTALFEGRNDSKAAKQYLSSV